jgi:hypothetical protein
MSHLEFGVPQPAPAFGVNGLKLNATNYQWVHTLAANPTTRPNGAALITGDRIYDTTTGEAWWWNGTLWLSHEFQGHSFVTAAGNNANLSTIFDTPIGRDVFVKEAIYGFTTSGTVTTTATVTITTAVRTLGAAATILFNNPLPTGTTLTTGVRTSIKHSVGVTAPVRALGAAASGVALTTIQTLGVTLASFSFGLRWALVR